MTYETLDEPADWDVADHKARRERTDVHRPSVINPADYEYVGQECVKWEDLGSSGIILAEREKIARHFAATGGSYSRHEHGGNCHVCGSVNAIYTHLFWHKPSNTYVRCGEDCADKLGDSEDGAEFRAACKSGLAARAGKAKAKGVLEAAGFGAAWQVYLDPTPEDPRNGNPRYEENIISDIVGRLVSYGAVSEKQIAFVGRLLAQIAGRAQIEAARAAEVAAAAPFPTDGKRQTVKGEVITVKASNSGWGGLKVLVKAEQGWKVWGTLPAVLSDAKRGDKVQFDAVLKVSDNDPKFGFASRPTNAAIVSAA